ncbi:MAG: hypothetical protein AB7G11_08135 [Phycisphaerales bacterium]
MNTFTPTLAGIDAEEIVVLGMIISGLVVWVLIFNVRKILDTRQRERTRREVAAYVAEGSIRPDDAAKILNAGASDTEAKIADAVAWGTIKPEKAEALLRSLKETPAPAGTPQARA